jgi:hypothetical protein
MLSSYQLKNPLCCRKDNPGMTDPNRQKMLLNGYRSLLRQAKIMVEDYGHLAPDAAFKIDPARRRRIARRREAIRKVEELSQGEALLTEAS